MKRITKLKKQISSARELTILFTDLTFEERDKLLFETGCEWAEVHTGCEYSASFLTSQPEFWAWWELEWFKKEEEFQSAIHYIEQLGIHALKIDFNYGFQLASDPETMGGFYRKFMEIQMIESPQSRSLLEISFHHRVIKPRNTLRTKNLRTI